MNPSANYTAYVSYIEAPPGAWIARLLNADDEEEGLHGPWSAMITQAPAQWHGKALMIAVNAPTFNHIESRLRMALALIGALDDNTAFHFEICAEGQAEIDRSSGRFRKVLEAYAGKSQEELDRLKLDADSVMLSYDAYAAAIEHWREGRLAKAQIWLTIAQSRRYEDAEEQLQRLIGGHPPPTGFDDQENH